MHLQTLFIRSCGAFLALIAAAKMFSLTGSSSLFQVTDPVFLIQKQYVMASVAIVECIIALYLLIARYSKRHYVLLIWLNLSFVVYRASLFLLGEHYTCPCLGTLTERLPIAPSIINAFLMISIVVMLVGSIVGYYCSHYSASRLTDDLVSHK